MTCLNTIAGKKRGERHFIAAQTDYLKQSHKKIKKNGRIN